MDRWIGRWVGERGVISQVGPIIGGQSIVDVIPSQPEK